MPDDDTDDSDEHDDEERPNPIATTCRTRPERRERPPATIRLSN
jgi:hypothetical protein